MMKTLLTLISFACLLLLSAPAFAQDADLDAKREQARPIAEMGFELLNQGKYKEAIAKLEEAEQIFHAPTHLLYIGRARKELGEVLTAYNTFIDIVVEQIPNWAPPQFLEAQKEAEKEAEALRSQVATIKINVTGVPLAQATVTIDGNPVPTVRLAHPLGVTPGPHTVEAVADSTEPASSNVEAVVGQTQEVDLKLASTGPVDGPDVAEEGSFPVLGTVTLALGGAALIVGAVTGVITLSRASTIKENCNGTVCPKAQEEEADDAKVLGNVSTGMFIAGGVLAAAGIVLIIVDPFGGSSSAEGEVTASLSIEVAPTGLALTGTF